jgi:hypothetical protein
VTKRPFYKRKKFWIRLIIIILTAPVVLFAVSVGVIYYKQDAIVKELITSLNKDFKGEIKIGDSHVAPFSNFPYISIDVDQVQIYEHKNHPNLPICDIKDVYLGFDLWTLIRGKFDIKSIKLTSGYFNLVQHKDGSFNIANAFEPINTGPAAGGKTNFHLDLKRIKLVDIDFTKLNESNNLLIEAYIDKATSKFKTNGDHYNIGLDANLLMNVVNNGDTTFIRHKHIKIDTELDYNNAEQMLVLKQTKVNLEDAVFAVEGSCNIKNDAELDIKIHGNKPNFDLLIAFAPEELIPVLESYENKGKVYFEAIIKGKSTNGNNPFIAADFGCEHAFFKNTSENKKLDDINFSGHFTNGVNRNASTTEFTLLDFSAKPGAGTFSGNVRVKNFNAPEVEMQVKADFELDFLAKFLNMKDYQDLKGSVLLTMNFKDVIDMNNIERSIERLNEAYSSELRVTNLSLASTRFSIPIKNINLYATMDGHVAKIHRCSGMVGGSDIQLKGAIDDLPAIIHRTDQPVTTRLNISSNLIDIGEIIKGFGGTSVMDEQITGLQLQLSFVSSARAFTESETLPVGEFFIDNLTGKFKHYPHTLHDIHADIFVEEHDLSIVDFSGVIDQSDFHFTGKLKNYNYWLKPNPVGDIEVDFNLRSDKLEFDDLFAYKGENYVPEDYRHEELKQLKMHGHVSMHYNGKIKSTNIQLTQLDAFMKIHPLKFENFNGQVYYEDEHIKLRSLGGKIGKSMFTLDLDYFIGKDKSLKKRNNHVGIRASSLDVDELTNFNPAQHTLENTQPQDHEKVFNIYDLPFTDMTCEVNIAHLNYHRILLDNIQGKLRIQEDHYIHIDELGLDAAGGHFNIKGYFNGANRDRIYFSPDIHIKNADIDKLFFKFENFGQDHLVSENVHGVLSGHLKGKVHVHADMVPIIDDSEIHFDMDVINGKLENYAPLTALSDFFKDKNLAMVLFDTLSNHIDLTNGVLTIPRMTINTTLGFVEFSGKQDIDGDMEYYIRLPLKLVTEIGFNKLFNKKREEVDPEQVDEIQYRDKSKKVAFINLKVTGNSQKYKISLGKDKNTYKNQ